MAQQDKRYARIQQKIDTTSNWDKATNFKPLEGEIIVYQDAGNTVPKVKIGHSDTLVGELPFITETIESDIDALEDNVEQLEKDIETTNSRIDPIATKLDGTNIAYATCNTAAATKAKVATIVNNTSWELEAGSIITVLFTNTNTVNAATLNVNGTGAKPIWYNGAAISSSSTRKYAGYKNIPITYVYDGTNYRFAGYGLDSDTNTQIRVYADTIEDNGTYDNDYPLLVSRTLASAITAETAGYTGVYGIISDVEENVPTLNPYTGVIKVKSLEINGDTPVMKTNYDNWVAGLDSTSSGTGKFITGVTQTDGKVSVTKGTIAAEDIPSHADSSDKFGKGTKDVYGHLKLSDSTSGTEGINDGIAATPNAVKAAYDLASTAKAAADAGANQNAFSNIKIGTTTIAADTVTDTVEFVGSNVTITPDVTNDKITFSVANGTTSAKGVVQLTDGVSSSSTTTAATPKGVKTAYDKAATAASAASDAQAKADSAYNLADTKLDADAQAVSAADADKLGGEEPSYYATASELSTASGVANSANNQANTNKAAIESINNSITIINGDADTEGSIANAITNEATARINADNTLSDRITTLETAVGANGSVEERIAAAVKTETDNRKAADSAIETAYKAADTQIRTDYEAADTATLNAAKSDATTKANNALKDAKEYADDLKTTIDTNYKAADSAIETAYKKADSDIITAYKAADATTLSSAKSDATTKANTAETNAKSYADGLKTTIDTNYKAADANLQAQIDTLNAKTTNSNGDAGKSVRAIAQEETAKIINNAPEAYDTLKEIADWISNDLTGAAGMASRLLEVRKEVYGTSDGTAADPSRIDTNEENIQTIQAAIDAMDEDYTRTTGKVLKTLKQTNGIVVVTEDVIAAADIPQHRFNSSGTVATGYLGDATNYGHLKLSDTVSSSSTIGASNGTAATPKAVGVVQKNVETEASTRADADTKLGNRITTLETAVGDGGSVETRIAAALAEAKEYSDQSEADAESAAKDYTDGRETAITQAYTAKIEAMTATSSGSGNFIKAISQTDGKISYTKGNISASEIPQHTFNSSGTATTGYKGNASNYGHLLLSDAVNSSSSTDGGTAATPKSVKTVQDALDTLESRVDPIELKSTHTNIAYGTCSTAAATAAKVITIQTEATTTPWALKKGAVIIVTFTATNTAKNPTFNVNSTGAKSVYYEGAAIAEDNLSYAGYKNRAMIFVYDGTGYRFAGWGYDGNTNTYMRTYRRGDSGYNKDHPLLASNTQLSSLKDAEDGYNSLYGLVPTNDNYAPTVNPYTGLVKLYDLTINNDLTVVGDASFNNLDIGGTLHVTGAADFDSTLNVGGATTLSTLSTSGKAALNSLEVSDTSTLKATSATTLSTSGKATLNSLEVTNASNLKGAVTAGSTLEVTGKIKGKDALEIIGNTDLNGGLDVGGVTTHTSGHVYLTGVSGTSTANTTQLVFGSSDTSTQHVALSSNDNALVINPTVSTTTPNQIVLYLNSQSSFPSGITGGAITTTGLTVNGAAKITGTSTLAGVTATTLTTSGKATLNSLEVSGTSKLVGALTASSASFSSGVSVAGQFTASAAAVFSETYGVQIGNGVQLLYNETKKCLNFTFL